MGAESYLSGAFGKNYLDEEKFAEASIAVRYQDFQHPTYSQLYGAFLPKLSAIDLLFNCGPESRAIIEDANPS